MKTKPFVWIMLVSLFLAGCGKATLSPVPSATPLPKTSTPTPSPLPSTPTATLLPPTPSETPPPTQTPTRTPPPTSTPLPALSGSGGGVIAFSSLRDNANGDEIYIMNADGSDQRRLTNNRSVDMASSWSPDGKQIAFSSDRDGNFEIYIMNADGSNQQRLTSDPAYDMWPVWSPDGKKIAFISVQSDIYQIYLINVDGADRQPLTTGAANNYAPAWSPDGKQIVFVSDRQGDGDTQIYVMNSDGSEAQQLTISPGVNNSPVWSPDGKRIAFMCGPISDVPAPKICLMDANGDNVSELPIGDGDGWSPTWSPDGKQIAFYSYRPGPYNSGKRSAIYVVNVDGSDLRQLTELSTHSLHPVWRLSPAAAMANLAYTYQLDDGPLQIYTINLDGSGNQKLVTATIGLNHLDWSPDGQKVAAVGYMDSTFTTWSIHVFNADGSNLVRLTHETGAADSEPAWSPDGTHILFTRIQFTSGNQYRSSLWLMTADGSDQHMVVADGFAGKWSPDGARLIYTSNKSGNYEIYTDCSLKLK